jgi:hypothetical protein
MSTFQTIPFNYPGQLEPIRAGVLETLGQESLESRKIRSCRYKSRCHSIYCPLCCRQSGYEMKGRILGVADNVPMSRLKFGTFTAKDVPLDSLREAGREIMHAGGRVLKTLKVSGYAGRLETSFEEWGDDYHAHLHVLIDSPSGGRGFIPRDAWLDEWLRELPTYLHPVEGEAHVEPVRNLEASCTYLTKSPFFAYVDNAERIVAGISACKGMRRSIIRGSISELGGVSHSVQSQKAA